MRASTSGGLKRRPALDARPQGALPGALTYENSACIAGG